MGYVDETPWYCGHALQWLWSMVTDTVALYRIDAKRSQAAFESLIKDWRGTLVSDGYGVYQAWGNARQSCLAHLVRRARELSQRPQADLAACGKVVLKELQRLCQMADAPPSGGQWQAWYARLCRLVRRYESRSDDAGRLVRHLRREAGSLWVFLNEPGVEPTNNRAERACALACCGARAPWVRQVPKATLGCNGVCRCVRRAGNWGNRAFRCWWTPLRRS